MTKREKNSQARNLRQNSESWAFDLIKFSLISGNLVYYTSAALWLPRLHHLQHYTLTSPAFCIDINQIDFVTHVSNKYVIFFARLSVIK